MTMEQFRIDPNELAIGWQGDGRPLGIIDLDRSGDIPANILLPPFPVIGIGTPWHPLAGQVDVLVEPPITLDTLAQSITASPHSAAIVTQVLRTIENLPVMAALAHESLAYGLLQASAEHTEWLEENSGRHKDNAIPAGNVELARDGNTLHILLDRPVARNAIDAGMRDTLREAFEIAAMDPEIETVRMEGVGKAFCVGADLSEFGTTRDPALAHMIRLQTLPAHAIARCPDKFEAHIQGACVGSGLEMAAFATRITATIDAWFHLPELAMGVMPGAGGCVSVSRRIGRQRAALMILSGKRLNAQTALEWGLVDAVIDD
ncbi:enoyl-CoA hydratase/isomerase family protein [Emcibacter nanhaiensis]|uniref:Enoyl-CoA hydratase/isomerase family protein n=1 Tax=Emcibacter nanhaiensis TaxID=1505037 RepID=A0A501PIJ8_9PROT|nr:enoyl-CoA hydratase/isomerase family protein [Emcibacter nanhaiensis]TPD59878.1 enoyl-CoA hydratase/isomerase family protein [Emcibacter nanhaiensis]